MTITQSEILFPLILVAALLIVGLVVFFFWRKRGGVTGTLADTLERPRQGLVDPIKHLLTGPSRELRIVLPKLEEILLSSDVGVETTAFLLATLRDNPTIKTTNEAYHHLRLEIENLLTPQASFALPHHRPAVFFFVGVNGTGKTTSIGKLASCWSKEGFKVLLVAADTFRAAACEQLKIWAKRSGSDCISGEPNADPASVVFNGIKAAQARGVDLVLIDTAGRLHTKSHLMEELKKMVRVASKELKREPDGIFMILDATTGQNGLNQVRVFNEALPISGLILTKYDGTSKGGVLLSVVRETSLPLRFVGVGEKPDDLKPFDAGEFVQSLFG